MKQSFNEPFSSKKEKKSECIL